VEVHFVARSLDPVRADRGLTVIPTDTPDTLPDPDLIVVPGSENPLPVVEDRPKARPRRPTGAFATTSAR
jgi:cyclohexyl-isocyanide hydratase